MNNIDIDIYVSQLKNFFTNNPNDLMDLIGDVDSDKFFNMIKDVCIEKNKKNEDITLTKSDIIGIVLKLKNITQDVSVDLVDRVFENTRYGKIGLN